MPPMPNSQIAVSDVKDVVNLIAAMVTIATGGLGVTSWFAKRFKSDDAMELLSKLSTSMNALTEDTSRLERYLRILAAVHEDRGNVHSAQKREHSRKRTLQDIDRISKASDALHEEVTAHLQRSFVAKYWNLVRACRKMREQCENIKTEHGTVLDLSSQSVREAMREGVDLESSVQYPASITGSRGMRPRTDWPVDIRQRGSVSAAAGASTSGEASSSYAFNLSRSSDSNHLCTEEPGYIAARQADYNPPFPSMARADNTRAFHGNSRESMSIGITQIQDPPPLHHKYHRDGASVPFEASDVPSNASFYQLPAWGPAPTLHPGNHQDLRPPHHHSSTQDEDPTTPKPRRAVYGTRGYDESKDRLSDDRIRKEPPTIVRRLVERDSHGRRHDVPTSPSSRRPDPVKTRRGPGQPEESAPRGVSKPSSSFGYRAHGVGPPSGFQGQTSNRKPRKSTHNEEASHDQGDRGEETTYPPRAPIRLPPSRPSGYGHISGSTSRGETLGVLHQAVNSQGGKLKDKGKERESYDDNNTKWLG